MTTTLRIDPIPAFNDNYIWCITNGRDAALVDPGEAGPVFEHLARERLVLRAILCTHHHADHVGGNVEIVARHPVPVYGPDDARVAALTDALREGERVALPELGLELSVLEIPGHTRSHIAFHGARLLFCGDTLFAAGCGRLFEGTPQQMVESLAKLSALPGDTRVYCGHEYTEANLRFALEVEPDNPALQARRTAVAALRAAGRPSLPSTLAEELATNPFLREREPAVAAAACRHAARPLEGRVEVFAALREWKNAY